MIRTAIISIAMSSTAVGCATPPSVVSSVPVAAAGVSPDSPLAAVEAKRTADKPVILVRSPNGEIGAQPVDAGWRVPVIASSPEFVRYVEDLHLLYLQRPSGLPADPQPTEAGHDLAVVDLRAAPTAPVRLYRFQGDSGFDVGIGDLLPTPDYFFVGGGLIFTVADTGVSVAVAQGLTEILPDDLAAGVAMDPLGAKWLIAQKNRVAARRFKSTVDLPPDAEAEALERCENGPCGDVWAFGTTGWHYVVVERACGDGCYTRCYIKDPKTGLYTDLKPLGGAFRWASLAALLAQEETEEAAPVECDLGFDASGDNFIYQGGVCTTSGCRPVEGDILGFVGRLTVP